MVCNVKRLVFVADCLVCRSGKRLAAGDMGE